MGIQAMHKTAQSVCPSTLENTLMPCLWRLLMDEDPDVKFFAKRALTERCKDMTSRFFGIRLLPCMAACWGAGNDPLTAYGRGGVRTCTSDRHRKNGIPFI